MEQEQIKKVIKEIKLNGNNLYAVILLEKGKFKVGDTAIVGEYAIEIIKPKETIRVL